MKKKMLLITVVIIAVLTGVLTAQGPQRMMIESIHLFEKEKVVEFLGLNDNQKEKIFPEIDMLIILFDPFLVEAEEAAINNDLPTEVALKGFRAAMAGEMGNFDRSRMEALRDKFMAYNNEVKNILKKYESQESDLQVHIKNIENQLSEEQKKKFNFRPQMRRRGGGGSAQRPEFDAFIIKPTFQPPRNMMRRGR